MKTSEVIPYAIVIGAVILVYLVCDFANSIRKAFKERDELREDNKKLTQQNKEWSKQAFYQDNWLREREHMLEKEYERRRKILENGIEERERRLANATEEFSQTLANGEKTLADRDSFFKRLMSERQKKFPIVTKAYEDAERITDDFRARQLRYKTRPALKAAEQISEISAEKRALIRQMREYKVKADEYEAIAPWLLEELEEEIQNRIIASEAQEIYSSDEIEDSVTLWLKPDEYRSLSPSDRNQLMVDRYFQQGKKKNWKIGMMYERYVGYLYEKDGWDVEFFGIKKKYADMGRDIVARKGKVVHVIQCKRWSKFKNIHENALCQLFGTTAAMEKKHPSDEHIPVFYTTTALTDVARDFAMRLGIEVHEKIELVKYPVIKCNIAKNGEKIYHLPSDQQYDKIAITKRTGEFYATTIKEAEAAGFRRAFRWRETSKKL